MNLEKNTIVTLDNDKRYFVASTANLEDKKYCLLIHETNYKDYKFCNVQIEGEKIKLSVINNAELQADLFNIFANDIRGYFENIE